MAGGIVTGEASPNKCGCKPIPCNGKEELCTNHDCTKCDARCFPGCDGCKELCEAKQPCKCCIRICGCKTDCYANGGDGKSCKKTTPNGCKRCESKCKNSEKCICYQCSCGTQCNGFLCACCYWCNPGRCKRKGTCDGFVLGKCEPGKCTGHGTYNRQGSPVYVKKCECGPKESATTCKCFPGDKKCRCIRGNAWENGNCLIKCDLCGKLCSQDSYIHQGTMVVVPLAIAMILIIVWVKYRDKFRKVFYELRGSFSRAPKHSSAYTNNLVGDRIPEEMNTDRYSFRLMPYAGLS